MKIDWGVHNGDLFEQIVAVMLLQTRPLAWRRRASRGDGGVDVIEPVNGTFRIYQIKSYTGALTSRRKSEIAESLETFKSSFTKPVESWNLVLPMDQSKEAEEWFERLTDSVGFPCHWRGETFVDGLAAANPHVIDYYLRDGKGRLETHLREWSDIVYAMKAGPVRAGDAALPLESLFASINREDPHFRYEFALTGSRPQASGPPSESCIMTVGRDLDNGGFLSISVFERYRGALEERPITGTVTFKTPKESHLYQACEKFHKYGTPLNIGEESVTRFVLNAPGGLSMDIQTGSFVMGPPSGAGYVLRLRVLSPEGHRLSDIRLNMLPMTRGTAGYSIGGEDESRTLRLSGTIDHTHGLHWDISVNSLEERVAVDILPAIRFLNVFCAPNLLELAKEYGPPAPSPLRLSDPETRVVPEMLAYLEALAVIQEYSDRPVTVSFDVTDENYWSIHEAAQLLRGKTVYGSWNQMKLQLVDGLSGHHVEAISRESACQLVLPLRRTIGDVVHSLGEYRLVLPSARVANAEEVKQLPEDIRTSDGNGLVLVPASSNAFTASMITTGDPR